MIEQLLMGQLLVYSVSSSVILAVLYLTYKWFMASENYHSVNRGLLWAIYVVSFCAMPVLDAIMSMLHGAVGAHGVKIGPLVGFVADEAPAAGGMPLWFAWFAGVYVCGIAVTFVLTVSNLVRLSVIIARGEQAMVGGRAVVITDSVKYAPFSFGNKIVIPREDIAVCGQLILKHESGHVELHHLVDLLVAQMVCVFQWYNPAAWLMREELKTVHEYQADARVIASDVNIKDYQMLLIKKLSARDSSHLPTA